VVLSLAGACKTTSSPPAADAGATGFRLVPPAGWRAVSATAPLAAAWEGPELKNGFTPTLNVLIQPRPAGDAEAVYTAWRDRLVENLGTQYSEVKILGERPIVSRNGLGAVGGGDLRGRLVILLCKLPVPDKVPMPLFAFGALYEVGDRMYVVGALTGAELDVATAEARPMGEDALVASLASFRLQ
jgi:hypothetical protein